MKIYKSVRRSKILATAPEHCRNFGTHQQHDASRHHQPTTRNVAKDKDIVKVGYIKRSGILSGGYDICEWATRTWVSENCPEWIEGTPIIVDSEGNFMTNSDEKL